MGMRQLSMQDSLELARKPREVPLPAFGVVARNLFCACPISGDKSRRHLIKGAHT